MYTPADLAIAVDRFYEHNRCWTSSSIHHQTVFPPKTMYIKETLAYPCWKVIGRWVHNRGYRTKKEADITAFQRRKDCTYVLNEQTIVNNHGHR